MFFEKKTIASFFSECAYCVDFVELTGSVMVDIEGTIVLSEDIDIHLQRELKRTICTVITTNMMEIIMTEITMMESMTRIIMVGITTVMVGSIRILVHGRKCTFCSLYELNGV